MGLFRAAVVVGAVVALMPTDRAQQMRIAEQASSAAHWTITFCERNATTCTQAVDLWGVFVKKAQFAAGLAMDVINDAQKAEPQAAVEPAAAIVETPLHPAKRGTLTPQDLKPGWRGQQGRNGI